jgi:hypothetical protein
LTSTKRETKGITIAMQIKINHADPFQQIQVNNCNESKAEKEQPGFCTFSAIQPFQDI